MNKGQRAGSSAIKIEVKESKSYFWCSCGKSSKQPFCDGSHKGTEFNPVLYKAELTKKMFFALVNKLITSHFVTAHIIKSNIANFCFLTIKF